MKREPERLNIQRGRLESIALIDVTPDELRRLHGSSDEANTCLNFAVFLLSVFTTLLVALLTTEPNSDRVYISFLVGLCVSLVLGIYFIDKWRREHGKASALLSDLLSRLEKKDPVGESLGDLTIDDSEAQEIEPA